MRWRQVPGRRFVTHCAIALHVVDEFSGQPPIGSVCAALEIRDGQDWRITNIKAVRTPGGLLTYPGLGRQTDAAGMPPIRCRVRIRANYYRAAYRFNSEGLEFDVPPYDDVTVPAELPKMPRDVFLFPAANYPFPTHVRVLRGVVRDANANPVTDAKVSFGNLERTLTNEDGAFSLSLRWPKPDQQISIDAEHHETGTSQTIQVQLPSALEGNNEIVLM